MSSTGYGPKLNPMQLSTLLDHIFQRNLEVSKANQGRGTPVCIWGTHGLGKTQLVRDYARKHGWKFAYAAPGQFEEMGDLHGMPIIVDPTPDQPNSGDEYTVFAPPEWVPKEEGPGILLLDDINRADDRILRGIMQLLQNFELFSWQLPNKWQIVATANPEGGDYSVTTMDDAMLTRMVHLSMVFEPRAWAEWAQLSGVDPRGIAFVLNYPEAVTGKRTTPRTIVQFFELISSITDWKSKIDLIGYLAMSTLDQSTMAAFLTFVNDELEGLPWPEEILEAEDFAFMKKRIIEMAKGKGGESKRVDRLSALLTRVFMYVTAEDYKPKEKHRKNIADLMLLEVIPNDLRMAMMSDLSRHPSSNVQSMTKDKRLSKLLLQKL